MFAGYCERKFEGAPMGEVVEITTNICLLFFELCKYICQK